MQIGEMFDMDVRPEKITTSPELMKYLKHYEWKVQDGHPKKQSMKKQFQEMLCQHPENIRFRYNRTSKRIKLMIQKQPPNQWEIVILHIPNFEDQVLDKAPKLRYAPTSYADICYPQKSDCSGSMKNYVSSDDVLTEFEIEETTKMVRKWIRNKVYIPSNAKALILLDSSSDSDTNQDNYEKMMRSFRRNKIRRPSTPPSPLAKPLTPSPPRIRSTRHVEKFDLFCDDSGSEQGGESLIVL